MTHTILLKLNGLGPQAEFECHEPDTAWCRQNVVGPGEDPPADARDCWFTVLASGFVPWGKGGMYDGPPTEMRSGEIEFTKIGGSTDFCSWRYKGDPGGHDYPVGPPSRLGGQARERLLMPGYLGEGLIKCHQNRPEAFDKVTFRDLLNSTLAAETADLLKVMEIGKYLLTQIIIPLTSREIPSSSSRHTI